MPLIFFVLLYHIHLLSLCNISSVFFFFSQKFNAFLKGLATDQAVTNILQTVNNHLASQGTKFLEGDELSYTDCFFLPRLQHLRVAGKVRRYTLFQHSIHIMRKAVS